MKCFPEFEAVGGPSWSSLRLWEDLPGLHCDLEELQEVTLSTVLLVIGTLSLEPSERVLGRGRASVLHRHGHTVASCLIFPRVDRRLFRAAFLQ